MKKNTFFVLILMLTNSVVLTGCFEEPDYRYDGPNQVEWTPPYARTITAALLNNTDLLNADNQLPVSLPAQLIGAHQSRDLTINFEIFRSSEPADAAITTTAEENIDYVLPGTTFTIPAGSSFGDLPINLPRYNGAATGTTRRIRVVLQDGSGYRAARNYRNYTLTIQGNPAP